MQKVPPMPEIHDHFTNARNLAVDILRKEPIKTPDLIRSVAEKAVLAQTLFDPQASVDIDLLVAELRHLFSVGAGTATALDDITDHVPWLSSKRSEIPWRFWNRYMTYLERDFGMPPDVVNKLDDFTSMILERLEDPSREPPWDRRGMVVGSVQSGKTANYTGLICKAVDAGYKLVVVLAGIHSNLRAQTQLRIDEGVLGFDTQKSRRLKQDNRWIGVGKLPGEKLVVHSLTSSAENGDFNRAMADQAGVMLGGDPVVLVVKKNFSLLDNLLRWVLHVSGSDDHGTGKKIVKNVPLLLIDDEADNASINIKAKPGEKNKESVSSINGKIRKLLDAFEKSAYVGYTATPFANIFINPEAESPEHGEDLFPRSFIISIKPPTNYIGPARVFGLDSDPDAGIEARDGLPIVINDIDDYSAAFPPRHKPDHVPEELPDSLKLAIRHFILTCAARRARGQGKKHNSMLIHVTRYVDVQDKVVGLVHDELKSLQRRIEFGDGQRRPTLVEELEKLWQENFIPVTQALGEEAGQPITWKQVREQLHPAASKITVLPINGYAKEALDYKEHEEEGRSVIAVGGDKLSRGLTLEGLSVSYFLRTSRMYDTLMQMGRWFGYRPGYLDLCRLFTTKTLTSWYRHIAFAETELRREFDYMVAAGLTPENYGLRVRTHPGGMIITAINKMSHGRTLELSWAGVLTQTTQLPKDARKLDENIADTENFLIKLGKPMVDTKKATRLWSTVDAKVVADFVGALRFPPAAARASGDQLAAFIRKQAAKSQPELTSWTVALISNKEAGSDRLRELAGYDIGLVERSPESQTDSSISLKKANLLSPKDEALDYLGASGSEPVFERAWFESIIGKRELADDIEWLQERVGERAYDVAMDLTRRWQDTSPAKIRKPPKGSSARPNGHVLRVLRPTSHGLLLIYPIIRPAEVVIQEEPLRTEQTGLDPMDSPMIGIALSFPSSESTLGVAYRVNKVWGTEMEEDDSYED